MPTARDEILHSYVTDMLALEEHINKAIHAQLDEFKEKYPTVGSELQRMHEDINRHIRHLRATSDIHEGSGGQKLGDVVKRAGSIVAGLGAAAIDLVRTEKLPKNLRDDYTAFSLANIGYVMLHTTALALDRSDVAMLAEQHLKDYARMLMSLQRMIPDTVIDELESEGVSPNARVTSTVESNVRQAWMSAT